MKAYVWTNPSEFQLQEVLEPVTSSHEVIVQVHYTGICGSDLSGYLGENSLRKPPLIMGHEFTGTVVDKGASVTGLELGELVAVNPLLSCGRCDACRKGLPQHCSLRQIIGIHRPGAFAELVAVPESSCVSVQNAKVGALTEPLACGIRAARQAAIQLGEIVVVFGAGIIGLFSVWAARAMGAHKVVLVDTNASRLKVGAAFGATSVVNVRDGSVLDQIADEVGGLAQRAIDAVGLSITRSQSIEVVTPGGTAVWIGLHEEESIVPANLLVRKEVGTVGSFCYNDDDFHVAHQILEQGLLKIDEKWVSTRPVQDIKAAFDEQIHGPAAYPKILLSMKQ